MRTGLAISGLAHVFLLAWSGVVFPSAEQFNVEPVQSLPVELVTPSELTRILAGAEDAPEPEPEQAPVSEQADEVKPQETAALPPEPEPAPEPPEPSAEPEPQPVAEPEPEPAPQAEPEPAPEPQPERVVIDTQSMQLPAFRPRPPRNQNNNQEQFDAGRIAALLDKAPDEQTPRDRSDANSDQPATLGQSGGTDVAMSISEIDLLRQQISRCWNPPVAVLGADELIIAIRLQLNPDGSLVGPPSIDGNVGTSQQATAEIAFRAAAESALRAVRRCAPYDLPAEKYDAWRDIRVTFDPRQMLGG